MDISTIATRARIPLRRVRYVLDHRLLPGQVKVAKRDVGQRRHFTDFEGFSVACAAALLHGGAKRETVLRFMKAMCDIPSKQATGWRVNALFDVFYGSGPANVMLGDNTNIRLQWNSHDTEWFQPETGALLRDYFPVVTMQIDLARVRNALRS